MKPLPEILRPTTLDEVIGQPHLLGEEGSLRKLIDSGHLPSIIFWGPPGVGKTTLAYILADHFDYKFVELSGVDFSIKKLADYKPEKKADSQPQKQLFDKSDNSNNKIVEDKPVVIFIDEIHRLNKSQQAQFLPYVERGNWILIGATTENPSFEVIAPLLSRAQVLVLNKLEPDELKQIMESALNLLQTEKYYTSFSLTPKAKQYLIDIANGDGRRLLNALQSLSHLFHDKKVTKEMAKNNLGNLHLNYDKHGEQHFDTISALHKSMRGSDPNAAVYYLGRMLEGGEDPLYIARRCLRFAAEDIGNADPQSLILANSVFESVQKIGMPESNVILAQLVIYLAKAPKSNQAYKAYKLVQQDIQKYGNLEIPKKIRNAPTDFMKQQGYGEDYKYAHDFSDEELAGETYLPAELQNKTYL